MLIVYRQAKPLPTSERFTTINAMGAVVKDEWHRAALIQIGTVETWEQAKKLHPYPITQQVSSS